MKQHEIERWSKFPTKILISEIQARFHQNLLKNLAQVTGCLELLMQLPGKPGTQLEKIHTLLSDFAFRAPLHLLREEQIIFPLLLQTERDLSNEPQKWVTGIMAEHQEDLLMIKELKTGTSHLQQTQTALSQEWKTFYQALELFLSELELHIAIENEVLLKRISQKKGLKVEF